MIFKGRDMMKKYIFVYYILFCTFFNVDTKGIIEVSIPKAGTYLLQKCIYILTGKVSKVFKPDEFSYPENFYHVKPDKFEQFLQFGPNEFYVTHLMYDPDCIAKISHDKYVTFFMYRDPRDQIISYIFFILNDLKLWPEAAKISLNDMIFDLIYFGKVANNNPPGRGISDVYGRYLPWLKEPGVCAIRFEDLIGPKGGGSLEVQIETIKKIANHAGIEITDKKIESVTKNLFGGTFSFRRGQIGGWKRYFTEDHKKAFKEVAGQLLIDLGYEKDFNW